MREAAQRTGLSQEEYLEIERASEKRHESADGEIFAMAGATREHSITAGDIFAELHVAPREWSCEVYSPEMRIKIESTGRYVYPDASVASGRPEFDEQVRDTLLRVGANGVAKQADLSVPASRPAGIRRGGRPLASRSGCAP